MHKDTSVKNGDDKKKFKFTKRWAVFCVFYLLVVLLIVGIVNSRHLGDFLRYNLSAFRPVTIGLIIAYIANPLYNFLHDNIFTWEKSAQAVRKVLSMVFTYAVVVLFIIVFLLLLLPQLTSSIRDLGNNLETYANETFAFVNETIAKLHLPFEIPTFSFEAVLDMLPGEEGADGHTKLTALLANLTSVISGYVVQGVDLVIDIFVGLFIAGYVLAAKQRLSAKIRRLLTALFRENGCSSIIAFTRETDRTFGRYVVGKLTDSALVIIICSVAFSLAGIPYAILVGFIVGATNIIPFFGPIFGAIPCGLLVFIAEPRKIIPFVILVLVVQQIDANIIDPFITGNATGLTSLGVIISVTVMGNYFGVLGMILGVPITVALLNLGQVFLDRRLESQNYPTELDPYFPPKTEEIDKDLGEYTPLITKILNYCRQRTQIVEDRLKARKAQKVGSEVRRAMTEDDVGSNCTAAVNDTVDSDSDTDTDTDVNTDNACDEVDAEEQDPAKKSNTSNTQG